MDIDYTAMSCDYCTEPAIYRASARIGPPVYVCEFCGEDVAANPAYNLQTLEQWLGEE